MNPMKDYPSLAEILKHQQEEQEQIKQSKKYLTKEHARYTHIRQNNAATFQRFVRGKKR
ncbi:MAG TPA: hypothetical protein PL124_10120 [Candidatus Cloacimonadota bacterium]|nr:hypothetical protein [Candidatus Cloacimonadota bacterium]HPS39756.1 hypothetical protein [Candidatus Cloacimonadota bacterium]